MPIQREDVPTPVVHCLDSTALARARNEPEGGGDDSARYLCGLAMLNSDARMEFLGGTAGRPQLAL